MSAMMINKENFEQEVMNAENRVLLDFFAPWCSPCRMVGPVVDEVAQLRPDVKVFKINIDEETELASRFQVMSIPTLVVMEKGQIITKSVGAKGVDGILEMLEA